MREKFTREIKILPEKCKEKLLFDDHYKCKICLYVVKDPVECNKCQVSYCGSCIDKWLD